MVTMRRQHDAAFKAKVAFEAAKGEKTLAQIASERVSFLAVPAERSSL